MLQTLGKMYGKFHAEEVFFFGLEGDASMQMYPNPNFSLWINREWIARSSAGFDTGITQIA